VAEYPQVLIGDAERERIREALQRHVADGRLTLEEFSDRLGEAYAARTRPDLDTALRGLPPLPPGALPPLPARRQAAPREARQAVLGYLGIVALLLTIWGGSTHPEGSAAAPGRVPFGAVTAAQTVMSQTDGGVFSPWSVQLVAPLPLHPAALVAVHHLRDMEGLNDLTG
jgi:hypothetical protein